MQENTEQIVQETLPTEIKTPKKRGRKPKDGKDRNYFGEREEAAFAKYVQSTDEFERSVIFSRILYPAFTKMIESIIRRYSLFVPTEEFNETFHDTMSFLITKVNNFDVNSNYKAYSYCGTICRHYLILRKTQGTKYRNRHISYDTTFASPDSDNRIDDTRSIDNMRFNNELIAAAIENLKQVLSIKGDGEVTPNERKIGCALVEILSNWEDIFQHVGTRKFNKASILYFIKEYTMLNTTEIRNGMRRFKDLYFLTKKNLIEE